MSRTLYNSNFTLFTHCSLIVHLMASIYKNIKALREIDDASTTFCIRLFPFNFCMNIALYDDEIYVAIPSSCPEKLLLQATIYEDEHADLEYINNYKNGDIVPIKGGGNMLLAAWDHFAQTVGVKETRVIDKSFLCMSFNTTIFTVSLRFLSMVLDQYNRTWYEKHGYQLLPHLKAKAIVVRNKFFQRPVSELLGPIKNDIDTYYIYVSRFGEVNTENNFRNLIHIYMYAYDNASMSIKNFFAKLWHTNASLYATLEHNLWFVINDIIDDEQPFIKLTNNIACTQ